MKHIFTSFNKMIYRPLMIAVCLLAMSGNAWGGTAKYTLTAKSSPATGGYVMASDNGSASFSGTATNSSKEKTGSTGWTGLSKQKFTLYVYASAKSGYTFKGWASSDNTNTTTSASNPMSSSSSNLYYSQTDADTYYAIFAKLAANKTSLSFGDKNTKSGWGNSKSVTVTYVHVGTMTAQITGTNATDFSFSSSSSSQSKTVVSNNTNTEASSTVTIYFNPQCNGSRSATLTFSGNGMTKTVTLSGNGTLTDPTFSTTDGSVDVTVGSTPTTTKLSDRVSTNSDGTITYTCNNSAVTISNGNFSATKAGEYTVNVSVAASCKYNAASGSFKITVNRLPASLTTTNGETNIYLAGMNTTTLDLSSLTTKVGNAAVKYEVTSTNSSYATIANSKDFSATQAGDYTIHASMKQNDQYTDASSDFKVTVKKLVPTVEWKEYDHIYSGNALTGVTTIKYDNKIVNGLGIELTSKDENVMTVDGNNLHAQIITAQQQNVEIEATTEETDYYASVTSKKTYTVEGKQTPVFMLNGKTIVAADTTIYLKIGETANMAFEKIDEANFSYPTTGGQATYTHNSTNHTGVITASYYGSREIVFEQTGTTTIFAHKRTIKIYVQKHPVTLATTDALNNKTWLVDDVFEGDLYTVNAPASGQPAQKEVTVTSSNPSVLRLVEGKWKAVGEGDATLTIAQESNDFWAGAEVTKNIHVSKHTPEITWSNEIKATLNWASIINNPVTSTNEELPFTVTSSDPAAANYVDGKLEVYDKNNDAVTLTLSQEGNYKWNAAASNLTKTFKVAKPANHVPFTLSSSNKGNFQNSTTSYATWSSNGYRMCDGGISEREDYVIIKFTGVPDTLSFDKSLEKKTVLFVSELPGTHLCEVYESADNSTWESTWLHNERVESTPNQSRKLKPSTRYLKFRYYGTVHANYKNIKVTERKEIVAPAELDFTSGGIGDNPTPRTLKFAWYNVKNCTVTISGADAKYFKLADGNDKINSHLDEYNEAEEIIVKYLHEKIAKHTATLTITSAEGKSATVTLKGETTKAAQEIIWNEDLIVDGKLLIAKDALYSNIATASSGLPVELYVADGETKLKVIDGETIQGLADGTTKLYARQAGNDNKWAAVTDNMDVQITSKTVQSIEWDDPLSNIQYTGNAKNVTLNAHSSEDPTGTVLPITYTLDKDAQKFASVSGNTLTITGTGTGKITAKQAGNNTYVAVSATRTLTAYNPNENCASNTISGLPSSFEVVVTKSVTTKEFEFNDEEPGRLSFTASIGSGSLTVAQYYEGTWHSLETFTGSSGNGNHSYTLNRGATKISFSSTIVIAWPTNHQITNMQVTKARYLEVAENYMDFSSVQLGQTVKRQFTVNYSDASGVFEVKLKNPSEQFELLTHTLGTGCGATGKDAVVKINCTGKSKGKENDTIIISNNSHSLCIPLEAVVTGLTQQIHWGFDDSEEIKTTDNIQLSATADSDTLPVTFSSKNESVAKIKKVGDNYYLDIIKDGEVEIVASQAGDDSWEPTEKSCIFHISKVTPVITKVPTVNEVVLPKQLKDCPLNNDAVVSVAGKLEWQSPATAVERFNTGYTVVFTPTNSNWYNTTTCTVVVPVAKDPQSITWTIPGEINDSIAIYCNASLTFNASASSTLNVSYTSSEEQIAYVDGTGKLIINRGGKVKITARQAGNETYAEAEPVEKIINILRVSPTIITLPEADTMKIGRNLSDATLTDGRVELGGQQVYGKFSWVDGNTTAMSVAGKFTKQIVFTPTEAGWYEPQYAELDVVVERYAPAITTMALTADDITYGTVLTGTTGLTGTIEATDTVKKPNVPVQGTYEWLEKADLYDVNTVTATAVFKPTNNLWYKEVEFEVPLHVNPAAATIYAATTSLTVGQSLSVAELENATTGIQGEIVSGTFTWGASVDATAMIEENSATEYAIHFTSGDANYLDGDGICTLTIIPGVVFEGVGGNSTWDNGNNWSGDVVPTADDRVIINADVVVTSNVEVTAMTINEGKTVTIADGATLTIGEGNSLNRDTYGNIVVEAGGQLNIGAGQVQVNDFTLFSNFDDQKNPKSGQVKGQQQITTHGDAYFILDLDSTGVATYGWYSFTVPFPVNAMTGVLFENGEPMTNEVHYAIMDYHEDLRAQGKYGWKKYRSILQPGTGYLLTVDDELGINRCRFKMVEGGTFNATMTQSLTATDGDEKDKGWNCIGNGTMTYVAYDQTPRYAQLLDHKNNVYRIIQTTSNTFVVGASYFVQAETNSTLTMHDASTATTGLLRAPQREQESTFCSVNLSLRAAGNTCDNLFVTCDEDAAATYTIGKDVQKMGATTGVTVARMWAKAKGTNLGAVDMPFADNEAIIPLGLYAPKAGEYTLAVDNNPAEAVYLTHNGQIIWNMAMGDYTFDLSAGADESYALKVVRRVNTTVTGVDQIDKDHNCGTNFVEKIIVNGQLFILRDGVMYDAQGKKVTTF